MQAMQAVADAVVVVFDRTSFHLDFREALLFDTRA